MSDIEKVKKLREATGAGFKDCNLAIKESNGDLDKAIEILRVKGISKASKKMSRDAKEGVVVVSGNETKTSVIEVNCETDFVAKNDDFKNFVKDVAMHIAAADPKFLKAEDMDESFRNREAEIYSAQLKDQGKPENMIPKIVEGKLSKLASEVCLYDQAFVKNPDVKIGDLVNELTLKIGEKIAIRRFVKFNLGEGIEKREDNLADEVAKMTGQ